MKALEINPVFARFFSELDYGQEKSLERSLKADLTSEPIVYWHNPKTDTDEILDGHHRYRLALANHLDLQTHEKHFETEDEALLFVIRNQTTRRNVDNVFRERFVKQAVDLQMKIEGKTKTEAVQETALLTNVSERTIWRTVEDEKPKNAVEIFKEAKAALERKLTQEKTRAVEKFKVQVQKEQMDEDKAQSHWQEIEDGIDESHKDEISELETLAEHAQQAIEDSPGLKNAGKRSTKKSTKDRAARRNTLKKALALIAKLQNEVFYFWDHTVGEGNIGPIDIALKLFVSQLEDMQKADAKKVKKRR